MEFSELEFKEHPNHPSGVQARHDFPNGYGVSVIKTSFSYGGDRGLYELAIFKDGMIDYDNKITDDVIGYLSPEGVDEILKRVEALDNNDVFEA